MAAQTNWNIQWRPAAIADIESIVRFIGADNPPKAREFGYRLKDKVELLKTYPKMGPTGRPGLPDYVRELVLHRHYIAFYRLDETQQIVEVLRIKHTSQQFPSKNYLSK